MGHQAFMVTRWQTVTLTRRGPRSPGLGTRCAGHPSLLLGPTVGLRRAGGSVCHVIGWHVFESRKFTVNHPGTELSLAVPGAESSTVPYRTVSSRVRRSEPQPPRPSRSQSLSECPAVSLLQHRRRYCTLL
eukprot:103401-Hanusia_phi.AAC.1